MPHILTLHLVNDLGSDSIGGSQSDVPSLWPGTPTPYDFTTPPQAIRPVWVGVSADGTTNQVYPVTATVASIIGAGWPRVYQGTEIVGPNGDVLVFSEQYAHVLSALAACCSTSVVTAAFALKQSNYPLSPEQAPPPCDADALFKWLAVRSAAETRTLTYSFSAHLTSADALLNTDLAYATDLPFTETVQLVKSWHADFPGLAAFALGTIEVRVTIKEAGSPVLSDVRTFRLPDICQEESGSSSPGESSSASSSASVSASASAAPPVAPISPDELSNLFAWYDIPDATTVTASGSDLTQLLDKGPNGYHLDGNNGGNYPQYAGSGGGNNQAYAKIQTVRDLHRTAAVPDPGPEMSAYIVYKVNGLTSGNSDIVAFDAGGNGGFRFVTGVTGAKVLDPASYGTGHILALDNSNTGAWQFARMNWSTTDKARVQVGNEPMPRKFFYYDGGVAMPLTNLSYLGIGLFAFQVGLDVDVAELILVQGAVTPEDDAGVRVYLTSKYGIAPPPAILFVGDSITFGYTSSNYLTTSFAALTAVNKGKFCANVGYPSGKVVRSDNYLATGTLTGIDMVDIVKQLETDNFDFSGLSHLVITYGTNEILAAGNPTDLANWKATYKAQVIRLKQLTGLPYAKIVLGTAPYQSLRIADTSVIAAKQQEVATELGCVFCDFITPTQAGGGDALLNGDLIHPDDPGHLIMANTLTPLLT